MDAVIKEMVNDQTGNFSVEIRETSVYLKVIAKGEADDTTFHAVKELLKKMEVNSIDDASVKKAINNLGSDNLVARAEKPHIAVSILDDDMKATVCLVGNRKYLNFSKADVLKELSNANVVFGIDVQAVEDAVANPGKQFVVAIGRPVVNGVDAQINFKSKIDEQDRGKPKEIDGGRVDYKNLDLFSGVLENDIIAEKIPATKGEDGSTVSGKPIKSIAGKDKRIKTGKNVLMEDNLFVSKIAGHLIASKDKIEVLPVLELNSDIDLATGNITFPGDVSVKGNVQAGFFVKAQGNVVIAGSVFGGIVEGRSVDVKHGIQSTPTSYVKAEESISAKFVENGILSAGTDVTITDTVLHSRISAGRKIIITGSKGLIAGGHVSAGSEVDAKNIGTQMAPPTIVEVGVNPTLKEEFMRLRDSYKESLNKQESIKKSLLLIKPDDTAVVPEARLELYMKMTKANFALLGSISEMKERLDLIEAEFDKLTDGKIKCGGSIFPGVKLVINNIVYPIRDVFQFATFYVNNGEVKFVPYSK